MAKNAKTYFRTGRLKVGLTQVDIAALLGVESSQVSQIESNKRPPTLPQLLTLETIYDARCDVLMGDITTQIHRDLLTRAKKQEKRLRKSGKGNQFAERVKTLQRIIDLLS